MKQFLTPIDMTGNPVTNVADPTDAGHAATKAYVDSAVEGLAWKDSVKVASVANINLAAPGASIDGVALATNDRFLAKDQTSTLENGIYIFNGAATPATRAPDASTAAELEQAVLSVEEGTSAGATFRQSEINFVLETDPVLWTSFGTSAPAASQTVAGIIEIASQAEADAGVADNVAITPEKMANWAGRKFKVSGNIGDGTATSFNIDHNFNMRSVVVEIFKNSGNYDTVIADITRPSLNRITITFATPPAANAYSYVIMG